MARFCGEIGYGVAVETEPGVYEDVITERKYFGDVLRNTRQLEDSGEKLNNDISVGNSISVLADAYAGTHFFAIRYVRWAGVLWTATNVQVVERRLTIRLGEVYNGPTPVGTPDAP